MRIHSTSFAAALVGVSLAACHTPAPPDPPPTLRCALTEDAVVPAGTRLVADLDGDTVWSVSVRDQTLRTTALTPPPPDAPGDVLEGDWREWALPSGGTEFVELAIGANSGDLVTAQPDRLRAWWLAQHTAARPLAELAGPGGSVRAWRDAERVFVASAFGAVRIENGQMTLIDFPTSRRAVLPERAENGDTRWVEVVGDAVVADGARVDASVGAATVDRVTAAMFEGREVVAWTGYVNGTHRVWWTPTGPHPSDVNTAGPTLVLEPGDAATHGRTLDGPATGIWFTPLETGPALVVSTASSTLLLPLDGTTNPTELPVPLLSLAAGAGVVWAVDDSGGLGRVQCTTDS